jgi:FlaA1/EpsC-like NDP-sugar epimerase
MDVDEVACREIIAGRVVLIIGAAGSIGAELTRRVFAYGPSALHLIDVNETGLHELRVEMNQKSGGQTPIRPWLCNISDRRKLDEIFESSRPQVVFHLGAYKHIGMMEENPDQAFETNVLGTLNVFEAAQAVQAEEVVFLSSHTAVHPPASTEPPSALESFSSPLCLRVGPGSAPYAWSTSSIRAAPSWLCSRASSRVAAPSP